MILLPLWQIIGVVDLQALEEREGPTEAFRDGRSIKLFISVLMTKLRRTSKLK